MISLLFPSLLILLHPVLAQPIRRWQPNNVKKDESSAIPAIVGGIAAVLVIVAASSVLYKKHHRDEDRKLRAAIAARAQATRRDVAVERSNLERTPSGLPSYAEVEREGALPRYETFPPEGATDGVNAPPAAITREQSTATENRVLLEDAQSEGRRSSDSASRPNSRDGERGGEPRAPPAARLSGSS